MGRSNSFPAAEPVDSQSSKTPIVRSATTSTRTPTSEADRAKQNAPRPAAPSRQSSVQTRYMGMLLDMDKVPRLHNILSSFFTWILLAGFIIFPGTFTTISGLDNDAEVQANHTASTIIASVKNIPLLAIAGACTGLGAVGMVWLWWYWRHNYVWLLNKIFLPGCLNSFAGVISTLINVYTQQSGTWAVTAKITIIVTGACMTVTGVLFVLYNFWVLGKVRRSHSREMKNAAANQDETLVEKVERKAMEPGLEPGSVV